MSQNRWRAPHQVCLTDEEFKAVKAEAARCDPPMPFSSWMRMVVMAQVEKNRQGRQSGKARREV